MEEHHVNKKRKLEVINNNNNNNKELLARKIKLYCPRLSKLTEILAWDDQRLDLGTIATAFGIEPATLKLNGHFISRGVDFIASSVTWRSLLSFFSSKGLATGLGSSGALLVDGKLSRCGAKRGHEPTPTKVDDSTKLHEGLRLNQATDHEDADSQITKKMKETNNVFEIDTQGVNCGNTGLKRKLLAEKYCPLIKRVRISEACSNQVSRQSRGHEESNCFNKKLGCGYQMHESMKRLRENDANVASSCKRTR